MSADQRLEGWSAESPRRAAAPRDLGTEGRKMWRELVGRYEFTPPELVLLAEFCRTADLLSVLRAEQAGAPLTVESKVHGKLASPLLAAIATAQAELRRLHAALAFPDPAAGLPVMGPAARGDRRRRSHRAG